MSNPIFTPLLLQPFGSPDVRYPYEQMDTFVSQEFLDIAINLLGENYSPELLMEYYRASRVMYPTRKMIGNPFVYYRSHYMDLKDNASKTRDMQFERAFNSAMKKWWIMPPIDSLRQYEALYRAPIDDSGLENGLVLHGVLSDVVLQHSSNDPANVMIVNPSAVFIEALSRVEIPEYVNIHICCLDERFVEIYRSDPSLERFRWIHINDIPALDSASQILAFATACPEERVDAILRTISTFCDQHDGCTVRLVIPSSYMKEKKSMNFRSIILSTFSVHHVLVIGKNVCYIQPTTRSLITLKKSPIAEVSFQRADLVTLRGKRVLHTSKVYTLSYKKFVSSGKTLHGLFDEARRNGRKITTRQPPRRYDYSDEIKLWYVIETPYYNAYRIKAYYCDIPTATQTRKNSLRRGKRLSKFYYSKIMHSLDQVVSFLEEVLTDTEMVSIIRSSLRRHYEHTPISMKSFWYLHRTELEKRTGFQADFCRNLMNTPGSPLPSLRIGACSIDEIMAAVHTHTEILGLSATKERILLIQLKYFWDHAYQKNVCSDRPLQDLLIERERRRDTYHALRESSVSKSLPNEKVSALMSSENVNRDLRVKGIISLKKDAQLSAAEIGALQWGDFISTPSLQISHLMVTKRLDPTGTAASPFITPESNRVLPLSTESEIILKALQKMVLADPAVKDLSEGEKRKLPMFSHSNDPLQGLTKNKINALSASALKELVITELPLPLPEGSLKSSTDLNSYGGDLLGAHHDYALRQLAHATADETAYLSGNQLVTTVGTHYCDYLHPCRQLTLQRKLDRVEDVNRSQISPFVSLEAPFSLNQHDSQLTINTPARRSTITIEIDVPDDDLFSELIIDCIVRFGMDLTANPFTN